MRSLKLPVGLGAAFACLALASSASADSISFMRGSDIWVASPDGTKQVQITHDGGYSYQSQADDGTFVALHGRRLRKLARDGRVLADFSTPVSGERIDPNTSYFYGPFRPEISPDGSKVAYEYMWQYIYNRPGCLPIGDPRCQDKHLYIGVGYSHSDRMTSWDEPGLGRQSGWVHPSWIGNDTVLVSGPSEPLNLDAMIDHPGDGNQTIQNWFIDDNAWHLHDGEVARSGDKAAFVSTHPRDLSDPDSGRSDDQVTIYRMNGPAPALPEQCFSLGFAKGSYKSPTFSPDGGGLAFEDSAGGSNDILVARIPSQAGGCKLPTAGGKIVITDAVQPDWGPADVPTGGTTTPPPVQQPQGGSQPQPATNGGPTATRSVKVSVARTTVAKALRRGLRVQLSGLPAGSVTVRALHGGRTVGIGRGTAGATGKARVTVRFTRAAIRRLAGKRTVRLRLVAGGARSVVTLRK